MKKYLYLILLLLLLMIPVSAQAATASLQPDTTWNGQWSASTDACHLTLTVSQSGFYDITVCDLNHTGILYTSVCHSSTVGHYFTTDGAATCTYRSLYLHSGVSYEVECSYCDTSYRNLAAHVTLLVSRSSFTPPQITASAASFSLSSCAANYCRIHAGTAGDYLLQSNRTLSCIDVYDASYRYLYSCCPTDGLAACLLRLEANRDYYLELSPADSGSSTAQLSFSKAAQDISQIGIASQNQRLAPDDIPYLSGYSSYLNPDILTYQLTFRDGSTKYMTLSQLQQYGLSELSVRYSGSFRSGGEGYAVAASGVQPVSIEYLHGCSDAASVTVSSYPSLYRSLSVTDTSDACTISASSSGIGTRVMHLRPTQSGVYDFQADRDASQILSQWAVCIYDQNDKEIAKNGSLDGWPLSSGNDYYLVLRYRFSVSYTGELTFHLLKVGELNGLLAPTVTAVTPAADGITVKWNAVRGAQRYRVFYKTDGGSWTKAADTTATSYTVTHLTSGVHYTFTARCVSSDGSSYTSSFDANGKTATYIAAPRISSLSAVTSGVTVRWDAVTGAEKYQVFYKTEGGGWTKAGTTAGTSYTVTGLQTGTTYIFTVRCVNAAATEYTSGFDANGKRMTCLDSPSVTAVTPAADGITVKWNAVRGAQKYRVFYKADGGSWTKAADTTATSYTVTHLTSGVHYTFTARCVSSDGSSYTSSFTSGKSATYIAAPRISSLSAVTSGVTVRWDAVMGAEKYQVFYKTEGGGWTKAGTTAGTSYTVTGLQIGTTYIFTVRCVNAAATEYTSGFDANGKRMTCLDSPTVTAVTPAADGITVKWNAVSGAQRYRVFYKTDGGSWTKAADTTATSYTVTGLTSGVHYTFTARCVSSDGSSYTSSFTSGKSATYIAAPRISSLSAVTSGVTVRWDAVMGAEKYQVFYKTEGGGWTKAGTTAGTSYTVTGLKAGTTYIFTVRCVNAAATEYTSGFDANGKKCAL